MLMTTQFRNYTKQAGITEDYHRVREFFIRLGYAEFTYARWDWMTTHTYLDKAAIGRIGVWENKGEIVGIATFDGDLGYAFCLALPEYVFLKSEMLLPNVDLGLKVAVVAPDGNFVSYCGMWYTPEAGYAVIEPVATDPDYRRTGLGKAAVLEGIRRVGELGAKKALVGSSQQFYYSIGLRPFSTSTIWRRK
jgi:GNAT superfamily N-acetyltransferase